MKRSQVTCFALCAALFGCSSPISSPGSNEAGSGAVGAGATGSGGAGVGGGAGATGGATGAGGAVIPENPTGEPVLPFEPTSERAYLRKVKGLLTGLAPTEEEVQTVLQAQDPAEALRGLIDGWIAVGSPTYEFFKAKMIFFFTNAFQQKGFTPTEDFKPQLLENAGFDLGPLGVYGDVAFPTLVKNLEESFARTA